MRVLVVEDEPLLRDGIVDLLRGAGHDAEAVGDGLKAVARGTDGGFELVVLDLALPKLDGLEVCRRLRSARPALVILMLTARGSEDDKVLGLREGADDYLTKPFGARELLARVGALGRRVQAQPAGADRVEEDGCVIDLGRCVAERGGQRTDLTPREVSIVRWLSRHRGRVVSRAELLEQVWGAPGTLQTRTVDMTIANLRKKLERDAGEPRIIVSIKGAGYAFGRGGR
jgi:two-component system, OmpR family, alkaline phosphatase synthesis response regulator PhoP